jgi:hypothetical protein
MPYFLGLDVAKDSFVAVLLDEAGKMIGTATTFSNNTERTISAALCGKSYPLIGLTQLPRAAA